MRALWAEDIGRAGRGSELELDLEQAVNASTRVSPNAKLLFFNDILFAPSSSRLNYSREATISMQQTEKSISIGKKSISKMQNLEMIFKIGTYKI